MPHPSAEHFVIINPVGKCQLILGGSHLIHNFSTYVLANALYTGKRTIDHVKQMKLSSLFNHCIFVYENTF